jgi:hypothetical protein
MLYVIRKNGSNQYVALPGLKKSYTTRRESARRFKTAQEAQADCCGNETVVPLYEGDYPWTKTPEKE